MHVLSYYGTNVYSPMCVCIPKIVFLFLPFKSFFSELKNAYKPTNFGGTFFGCKRSFYFFPLFFILSTYVGVSSWVKCYQLWRSSTFTVQCSTVVLALNEVGGGVNGLWRRKKLSRNASIAASKAGFTQVKFFNGYPSNYILKISFWPIINASIKVKICFHLHLVMPRLYL